MDAKRMGRPPWRVASKESIKTVPIGEGVSS